MKFNSEPWGDTLPLSPLRTIWIFFCLLILPSILYVVGLPDIHIQFIAAAAPFLACIGTPLQLGIKKISFKDIGWVIVFYVFMMAVGIILSQYWEAALETIGWKVAEKQAVVEELEESSGYTKFVLFFSVCISAPFIEEVLFRRIIYGWFREVSPAWIAVIVTSLLFSLVHFFPNGFVTLFIMGMMFNLIFLFRENLLASIMLHSLTNSIVFILSTYSA